MMAKSSWTSAVILALATTSAAAQQPPDQQQPPAAPPTTAVAAAVPTPPPPPQDDGGFIEKTIKWADDHQIKERLSGDVDGWYPRLGGMTRGSGFAIGPGYRTHLGSVFVDLSTAISFKNYRAVDAKVRWFQAYGERFEFWTNYRLEDFPQEDFYGLGMSSLESNRVSYDLDSQDIRAIALYKPWSWLESGVRLGYTTPDVGPGSDKKFPSIEELFVDAEAAGLIQQPNFLYTTLYAEVDYLDEPGRPRSGGYYRAAMGFWNDRTTNLFDFKRFDALFTQYHPLNKAKKHIVFGRLGFSFVNNETGSRVPFYYLPYVGGVDTVRAFNEFRFSDENALWMTAEYHYVLMKWVTLAAFADAGKVAPNWQDISATNLKGGYGFGVRVHSDDQNFARVDFGGGGGEGWRVFLKLGPTF